MPLDPRIPLGLQAPQIQSPMEALSAITQLQGLREQSEARRVAAEAARTKHLRQQQIDDAYAAAVSVDRETGKVTLDHAKLVQHLPGSLVPAVLKELQADEASVLDIQTKTLGLAEARRKHLQSAADTVAASGYDPTLFGVQLRGARDLQAIDADTYAQLSQLQDPAQIQAVVDGLRAQAGKDEGFTLSPGQTRYGPRGEVLAEAPAKAEEETFTLSPGQVRYGPGGAVLASVPPTPPAPRDERLVQVIGPNGQAIWVRESQAVGKPAGAAPGDAGAVRLSAAQQEDLATMLTVEQLVGDVQGIDKEKGLPGVGPLEGRFFASARGSGGTTGETLRNLLGNIQGTIAKLRGGASFTPQEQAMLDRYTPTTTDTDTAVRTKLTNLVDFIQKKRANTLRVAAGQYELPPGPTDARATPAGSAAPADGLSYQDYLRSTGRQP
jgi:hypothetical protein